MEKNITQLMHSQKSTANLHIGTLRGDENSET